MKKTILSISLLCIGLVSFADVVPSSKALSVAKEFMNNSSLTLVWDGNDAATKGSEDAAFYVYNVSGGGWVIVSAEDSATPILAYSDKGSFTPDDMPSNMKGWLGIMKKGLLEVREKGAKPSAEVKAKWDHPGRRVTKADNQVVLETVNWDQDSPYNGYLKNYVKKNNQGVSGLYTGCVATAMSEVLKYHKWPEHGTGTIGGYTTSSSSYTVSSFSIENHTYDWDNMLNTYGSSYTTAQGNAVAQLMADCGIMVEMDYTTSGSGALSTDIIPALVEHMQYSKSAQLKFRTNYSSKEWFDMIKYDIDNVGPILYAGDDPENGGHQFVCDGYDADNGMVHINWGWSGDGNGFFTHTLSVTISVSSYSSTDTFSQSQSAIFGLTPDRDGSSTYPEDNEDTPNLGLISYVSGKTTYSGVSISGTLAKGQTFELTPQVIFNDGAADFDGYLKFVHVDKDGNWVEDVSSATSFSLEKSYLKRGSKFSCSYSKDPEFGDRIVLWHSTSTGWSAVGYNKDDYSAIWSYALVDVSVINVDDSYSEGDLFFFRLSPKNTVISNVEWKLDGETQTGNGVALTSGTHEVSATITYSGNTKETIYQTLNVK